MVRTVRWIGWGLAVLLGFVAILLILANTPAGFNFIENQVARLTGGEVRIARLDGRFPDALRVGRVELNDRDGLWLAIDDLRLDWAPSRLLTGRAVIDRLQARHIALDRLPVTKSQAEEKAGFNLPVRIALESLHVDRLELAEDFAGVAAALAIEGSGRIETPNRGTVDLIVRRIDGESLYTLRGRMEPGGLSARLTAGEPGAGLLSGLAGLPAGLGPLKLDAAVEGPLAGLQTTLALKAGPIKAEAGGTLDLDRQAADLTVTARSPALELRPDLSWRSVDLDAHLSGPFARPTARAVLRIEALGAAGTRIARLDAEVTGDAGNLNFSAGLDGIEIPGARPDLLRAAPLRLDGKVRLDKKERPLSFILHHPLVTAEGDGIMTDNPGGRIHLKLSDLEPFAAMAGLNLRGNTEVDLHAVTEGEILRLDLNGGLAVTGGMAPVPGLVGDHAKLDLSLAVRGDDVNLTRAQFVGKTLELSAEGKIPGNAAALNFNLALSNLQTLSPRFSGRLAATGQVQGRPDDLAVTADLNGEFAAENWPRGPITASVRLHGLPRAPTGTLRARGVLDRAPLNIAVKVYTGGNDVLRLDIDRAAWKSAHAEGAVRLPKGAVLPVGNLDLRMTRLADLQPLLGRKVTGSVAANLETTARGANLRLDARDAGFPGASVARAELDLAVSNPGAHPVMNGRLNFDGIIAGATSGSARLEAAGPDDALALRLTANLKDLDGSDARLNSAAILDVPAARVTLSALEAAWKEESLKLLEPAGIAYRDRISIDRLRVGLGKNGELNAAGRVAPDLDLTISVRDVPADLARLSSPGLAMEGILQANASLSGPPGRPRGDITMEARGIRLRSGPGRAMPLANLTASANLHGDGALIDARLDAGPTALNLSGAAPFDASGPLDLRARGQLDLALFEPLLAAQGRRVRGQIKLDAHAEGSLAAPRADGTAELTGGEFLDYVQGAHLTGISALLRADRDTLRLERFDAHAGPGTVRAGGTVGIRARDIPIDLQLKARNAQPLSSDRLTVNLDADLSLRGQAASRMVAAGGIRINRAEIKIPEHMPASIAVLNVRRPGEKPTPVTTPGPKIKLNLDITAPDAVFVRGRGVDAELSGKIRVRGTLVDPKPLGSFGMRRGQFSIAGNTLTFSKGEVGFYGGSLTNPSLRFIAETTAGNVTATLSVAGTAKQPKITLSSEPSLPPDEVLAQLLFGRGTANLSPLEWVQIASAVGSLTGIVPSGGDSLETVRKGLGLDRLSVGADKSGSPTLEAGRYVAPGVYVGTRQSVTGTGSQATVQIDVAKGLKLESSVGTGAPAGTAGSVGTSSVGVIYEFEY